MPGRHIVALASCHNGPCDPHGDAQLGPRAGSGDPASGDTQKEAIIARRVRAHGLAAGRSIATIAAAIHDECEQVFGTTWIRAYRLASGTALADIVERVRACYEHEGRGVPRFSETLLSAYESGHKRPGSEYLHYLCSVYGADPEDLGYAARCLCGRSHRASGPAGARVRTGAASNGPVPRSASSPGGTVATSAAAASGSPAHLGDTGEECDDVLRRALLGLMAGASLSLDRRLADAVDGVRRRLDRALLSSGVAATTLDEWEEAAASYGRQYMTAPPLRLLCDVLLDLSDVRGMCEVRQSIEAQERLCRLAARLAALTGMTMIDVGDHRLARSFFRTARTAADETGDRTLRAWVVARESLVPLYYGDPREALRFARISQDLAGRTPCPAGALAAMVEARAIARAGPGHAAAAQRAARAIERAFAVFGKLSEDQRADAAFGYTGRQLLFHHGEALAELGAGEADQVLEAAIGAYPASECLDRSLIHLDRAMCHVLRGDVDEAVRVGVETIDGLRSDYSPEIVVHRARDLVRKATALSGKHRSLLDFRDRLAAMGQAVS